MPLEQIGSFLEILETVCVIASLIFVMISVEGWLRRFDMILQ